MPFIPFDPRPRPIPRPWPPAPPNPVQIELNAYDLDWLAMGGTVHSTAANAFIRMDPVSVKPGAFLLAAKIAGMPVGAAGVVKEAGATFASGASGLVIGSAASDEERYNQRDAADAAEIDASGCHAVSL